MRPPAGVVHEAVLALDLADSTQLAIHYGDRLAMRARNFLEEASAAAGRSHGATFVENTGDGSMMTFASVIAANSSWPRIATQALLLRDGEFRVPVVERRI